MKTSKALMEERFKNTPHSKLVIFHGPQDCSRIWYEKVNPTHRAIIWGQRKKSENKGVTQIKLGEMYFGITIATSVFTMAELYTMLLTNAFPDISIAQATFCLLIYGFAGVLVIFPRGIGRAILCGVHSLIHSSPSEQSLEQ